jgi:hypothetical protein
VKFSVLDRQPGRLNSVCDRFRVHARSPRQALQKWIDLKVSHMDQKAVSALEEDLQGAILSVIMKAVKARRIPVLSSHRTIHLMAKAAAAVYETAVEVSEAESRDAAVLRGSP